jgi:hypothetical protein
MSPVIVFTRISSDLNNKIVGDLNLYLGALKIAKFTKQVQVVLPPLPCDSVCFIIFINCFVNQVLSCKLS